MTLVSLNDRLTVLRLIRNGDGPLSRRDRTLFSLANQTTWTDAQRALVDRMQREDRERCRTPIVSSAAPSPGGIGACD